MRLLLDTCAFLWVVQESSRLSAAARAAYLDPGNECFLSAVSVWEATLKHSAGKLPLPRTPRDYVERMRATGETTPLPIDEESALHVATLPRLHADPFDRMLVAQAIIHNLIILTPDPLITAYPARTLW